MGAFRHGYAPPAGRRRIALAAILLLYAVVLAAFFLTVRHSAAVHAPSAPIVVSLIPLAAAPAAPPAPKEAPRPVEQQAQPAPAKLPPIDRTIVRNAAGAAPTPLATPRPVNPGPPIAEAAAPRPQPAPLAAQSASNAADSWEGRLLAALHKVRRYPRLAMNRRQQGVPYIRFVIDREGRLVSSRLERSSGFPELDREALALPKRAAPLPKPPADRPGETLELVVPVEFFLR